MILRLLCCQKRGNDTFLSCIFRLFLKCESYIFGIFSTNTMPRV